MPATRSCVYLVARSFFFQRETTPRNSARLVSLLSCARIEQLRLARTPLFHSATASRRVIVTLANFASTILHAATRHAWNRRFVPAFSSFLLIRHCSEKNHPWWAVVYGMCKSKLLLEQINLKSEKWIRGMEIVEQFWNRYFSKFIIGGETKLSDYYIHVSLKNLRYQFCWISLQISNRHNRSIIVNISCMRWIKISLRKCYEMIAYILK